MWVSSVFRLLACFHGQPAFLHRKSVGPQGHLETAAGRVLSVGRLQLGGLHGKVVLFLARTEGGGTWFCQSTNRLCGMFLMTLCDQTQLMVSLLSHPPPQEELLV